MIIFPVVVSFITTHNATIPLVTLAVATEPVNVILASEHSETFCTVGRVEVRAGAVKSRGSKRVESKATIAPVFVSTASTSKLSSSESSNCKVNVALTSET